MLQKKAEIIDEKLPQKILVCAPSNVAIDNLLRIYKKNQGLFEVGGSFAPKVLRVGPFVADDLRQDYSLEEIAR